MEIAAPACEYGMRTLRQAQQQVRFKDGNGNCHGHIPASDTDCYVICARMYYVL